MDILSFLSSIILGLLTLAGLFVTTRRVDRVRTENDEQHGRAQEERAIAHGVLVGKIEHVNDNVQTVVTQVGALDEKLDSHINDIEAHGDTSWKTLGL